MDAEKTLLCASVIPWYGILEHRKKQKANRACSKRKAAPIE